jgi:hypothetical protein
MMRKELKSAQYRLQMHILASQNEAPRRYAGGASPAPWWEWRLSLLIKYLCIGISHYEQFDKVNMAMANQKNIWETIKMRE